MATTGSLYSTPWNSREAFLTRLGTSLGTDYNLYTAPKASRGTAGDFTLTDLTPYTYQTEEYGGDNGMYMADNTGYKSAKLDELFGAGNWTYNNGQFRTNTMADPTSSTAHPGSWVGSLDAATGKLSGLQWINTDKSDGFLGNIANSIGDSLTDYGWAVPLAGAALAPAAAGATAAGAAAPISASPITSLGPAATLSDVAAFTGATGASTSSLAAPAAGLGTATAGGALAGGSTVAPAVTAGSVLPAAAGGAASQIAGQAAGQAANAAQNNNSTDGWLAAILNAISQNKQGNLQQEWADRLYNDRKQFLNRLAESYTNPAGVLQGDEYQSIAGTVLDQLQRKDAARGRLATDVQRQKLMQDHAWEWLGKYRSGLATAAGLQGTSGLPELDKSGLANEYGTLNSILSQMSRGQANGSFDINKIIDTIGDWF